MTGAKVVAPFTLGPRRRASDRALQPSSFHLIQIDNFFVVFLSHSQSLHLYTYFAYSLILPYLITLHVDPYPNEACALLTFLYNLDLTMFFVFNVGYDIVGTNVCQSVCYYRSIDPYLQRSSLLSLFLPLYLFSLFL